MANAILGEIKLLSFPFSSEGWTPCNGSMLDIDGHQELYSVLENIFGGDGRTTFALPELRGRVPMHPGKNIYPGRKAGEEVHGLTADQIPAHTHQALGISTAARERMAQGNSWASSDTNPYGPRANRQMKPQALGLSGGGQPHSNMQPYIVIHYAIAMQGTYPSRNKDVDVGQCLGEIRIFAGNYAPGGWSLCDGRLLQISEYEALYSILGTTYGGDGRSTFAVPDLSGRAPLHQGYGPGPVPHPLGETGGAASVTLTIKELPEHSHLAGCQSGSNTEDPAEAIWANTAARFGAFVYAAGDPATPLSAQALGFTGGKREHNNMQPYLGVNFIMALQGEYPTRP